VDIDGRQDPTPEPPPDPTRCPSCRVPYRTPLDQRYGYCWECHDFTGVPIAIVLHGDEAFGERVRDKMQHTPPPPIRVMTDEEQERMLADNLAEFRFHERAAMTIRPPEVVMSGVMASDHLLIGSLNHGAFLYEPDPTRWQRFRGWLRGLSARR
jgi:hypothetical protein